LLPTDVDRGGWRGRRRPQDPVTVVSVPGLRPERDSVLALQRFDGDEGFLRSARRRSRVLSRVAFVRGELATTFAGSIAKESI